jgi:hypothetical protein
MINYLLTVPENMTLLDFSGGRQEIEQSCVAPFLTANLIQKVTEMLLDSFF